MPPVPLHINDPIAPSKAEGVTPLTTDSAAADATGGTHPTTTQQTSTGPPARPGAAAVPAPTPFIPTPAPPPTQTTTSSHDGPAPPQPGAVPMPPGAHATPHTASSLPPPPKAGETAQRPPTTTTTTIPPPQMSIPPPSQNFAPTHSTTTATAPASSGPGGPTTLNFGAVPSFPTAAPLVQPMERPAGYQQDAFAQELSAGQRATLAQQEQRERAEQTAAAAAAVVPGFGSSLGGLGEAAGNVAGNETVANVWNAVKGWASTAGTKLAETEEEVWKRINNRPS